MHKHFDKYLNVEELLLQAGPRLVVELGASSGENTRQLLSICSTLGALLVVVSDGKCPDDLRQISILEWRWGISYLELENFEDGSIDFAIVDTDHNSWTVEQELDALSRKLAPGGLVVLHDTESFAHNNGWMYGYACRRVHYDLEAMMRDTRAYGEAVRSWIGRGFELVRETSESAGAMALRRTTTDVISSQEAA